ncbi:MAG: response regulator [Acidimicrobiales bacterium]
MIRVVLVEDHPLYRRGLLDALSESGEVVVVALAGSIEEIEACEVDADLVVLDLNLPGRSGVDAVGELTSRGLQVLVLSASGSEHDVVEAIGRGAGGYLTKRAEVEEILRAISIVSSGGLYVSPTLASYLIRAEVAPRAPLLLTPREREVLRLLAEGETDHDIAEQLFISVSTVHSHLDRIREKTGQRRRAGLTRLAFEEGVMAGSSREPPRRPPASPTPSRR